MLDFILKHPDLIIFKTDDSGFITFINDAVVQKLGYSKSELLQSSFVRLVKDEDRSNINLKLLKTDNQNQSMFLVTQLKTQSGELKDAQLNATSIFDFDDKITSYVIIASFLLTEVSGSTSKVFEDVVFEDAIEETRLDLNKESFNFDPEFVSQMNREIGTRLNLTAELSQELFNNIDKPTEKQIDSIDILKQNRLKIINTLNLASEYFELIQKKSQLHISVISITDMLEKLDSSIKTISSMNKKEFMYGKISSSLIFKSDRERFEKFILNIFRVTAALNKNKKIYFSSYSVGNDSFIVSLSDQYGAPSEFIADAFEDIFNLDKDPKNHGISKLSTYPSKVLLSILNGKYVKSSSDPSNIYTGFIFPNVLGLEFEKQKHITVSKPLYSANKHSEDRHNEINVSKSSNIKKDTVNSISTYPNDPEKKVIANRINIIPPNYPGPKLIKEDVDKTNIGEYLADEKYEPHFVSEKKSSNNAFVSEQNDNADFNSNLKNSYNVILPSDKDVVKEVNTITKLDFSKLKCLYMDYHTDSQELFQSQMSELGEIKFAVNFEEARKILHKQYFDFIIIDVNLQVESNKSDAIKIVKSLPAYSNIPIIATAFYIMPGDKERFISEGFSDLISKPILKEKIKSSLDRIFSKDN
jgi:PAS domain S-box-containing protein